MTTTPTIEFILGIFETTLQQVNNAVSDVPDERMAEQPGALVNHGAWTLSHLVASAGGICHLLDEARGAPAPHEFPRFGPGSVPVPRRDEYEPKAVLLAKLAERHALAAAAARVKHADYFDRPAPEALRRFAPTVGRLAVYLMAAHESYHVGQLVQWRRAAGLAG